MNLSNFTRPHPDAVRFTPFFIGLNFQNGVHLPFFPVWLASVGFDPYATGLLMAGMAVLRVVTGPILGVAADAFHARRLFLIVLSGVAAAAYFGYATCSGVVFVVLFSLTTSAAFSAIGPLIEGVTLSAATKKGFDYGRVRGWGSAAFVAMNFFSGAAIAATGIAGFLPILIAAGALTFMAAFVLPREVVPAERASAHSVRREAWQLVRQPLFMLMIAATGIAQASHTFYYGFGTLNWQSLHYDAGLIGSLWALGVIAEIVLLMYSTRVVARFGAANLMIAGAAAGIVRWTAMAFSPPLWLLVPVQCLHAGTFCAVHLGTMHFILRATPPHLIGTAQSIYAAVTIGVFFSLGQYGSGALFGAVGSLGFLAMAGLSAVALVLSLLLGRVWDGGVLALRS